MATPIGMLFLHMLLYSLLSIGNIYYSNNFLAYGNTQITMVFIWGL